MKHGIKRMMAAVLIAAASFSVWLYVGLWVPRGAGDAVAFSVRERDSAREVATRLRQAGLIRSAVAFRLAARWRDGWRAVQAGDYALRPAMSALEILRRLRAGDIITEMITIPEGFTLHQMAQAVQEKGLGSAEEFLAEAVGEGFEVGFPLPRGPLEGYLFPDTYRVGHSPGAPRRLVRMMLERFEQVVWEGLLGGPGGADLDSAPPNLHEVLTLASLVEGEARLDAERPLIAGVLAGRLRRGMKLECDATVQYALGPGNHKSRLTYQDLRVQSPYNTYLHPGLPPGPINAPGRASIEAALRPADTPYLFYVARPDGSHIFSRTFAEHQRAIAHARALRGAAQAPAPAGAKSDPGGATQP